MLPVESIKIDSTGIFGPTYTSYVLGILLWCFSFTLIQTWLNLGIWFQPKLAPLLPSVAHRDDYPHQARVSTKHHFRWEKLQNFPFKYFLNHYFNPNVCLSIYPIINDNKSKSDFRKVIIWLCTKCIIEGTSLDPSTKYINVKFLVHKSIS